MRGLLKRMFDYVLTCGLQTFPALQAYLGTICLICHVMTWYALPYQ